MSVFFFRLCELSSWRELGKYLVYLISSFGVDNNKQVFQYTLAYTKNTAVYPPLLVVLRILSNGLREELKGGGLVRGQLAIVYYHWPSI